LKRHGIVFMVTLLAIVLASGVTYSSIEPAAAVTSSAPSSTCGTSTDSTATLQTWINSQPADTTLTMPAGSCWNVNGTITIQSKTALVIDGNGSTFMQAKAPAETGPILQLWLDSAVVIENLNVHGALGSAGGSTNEGDYGVEMEADSGVYLMSDTLTDIQGDFVYLSPPYDVNKTSDALNKAIFIVNSTFTNSGYHGLTIESVDGFVVDDSTFSNIPVNAMDLEYDTYSTPFNADGTPYWAAQDNIQILNNTWNNWGYDWFVSDQGQTPGVQEQHITLSGNTLNANSPLIEIVGTPTYYAPSTAYLNIGLTVENNTFAPGAYALPYRGSNTPVMSIYSVAGLDMENNSFPLCPGTYGTPPTTQCLAAPYSYAMDLYNGTFDVINNNNFSGAVGIREPQTYDQQNAYVSECGNTYGANGTQTDATCS
jgi:hypothetical protein